MAWTKTSVGKYVVLSESDVTLEDNDGANIEYVAVSSVIPASLYNFENAKFPVLVDVTTASDGAGATVSALLQVSTADSTTDDVIGTGASLTPRWADAATLAINTSPSDLGVKAGVMDATDVYAPYGRIALKVDGVDLDGDTGRVTISIAFPG
jgi:hypothetical protein